MAERPSELEDKVRQIIGEHDPAELLRKREELLTEPWIAALAGDVQGLRRFIETDPKAATDPGGPKNWPPLLYVCFSNFNGTAARQQGFADCAQMLLEHGADPDSHFYEPAFPTAPQAALYGAIGVNNNPLLADVLLRHGANTQDGESIYHAAQHAHIESLEVLKKHGADFSSAQQPWGNTPLYFLFGHRPSEKQWPIALEGIRWLLEVGEADPNVTSTQYEEAPLHLAARRHAGAVVELLLEHGAHADQPTRDGLTPYALAARHGNTEAMDALRKHGGNMPLSPADELLAACALGDELHARGILAGDSELLSRLGPRDLAILAEHAAEGNLPAVTALCAIGFPLDARGEAGATALHHAAWRGHAAIAQLLAEGGAPLDVRDEEYKATPLDWACHGSLFCQSESQVDYPGVVEALLQAGAPVPEEDEDWGSEEVKELLRAKRDA